MTPRLLSEEDARAYLGGIDPRKVCAPRHFGRAIRWDVDDLNAALDAQRVTAKPSESGGVERHTHDLRGTAATRYVQAGLTDEEIATVMGWDAKHVARLRSIYVSRGAVARAIEEKMG